MKKIRLAIIGQGRSGRDIHAYALKKEALSELFEIAAVVEAIPERRERAKKEYDCPILSDYTELFAMKDSIDLVTNSTFSHQHVPVSLDLMRHGFNVLCEKPLAKTAAEVDELIRTAKENNVVLAVFQQSRYAPHFVEIKRIIDSGVLGKLIYVHIEMSSFNRRWDWQTVQAFNAGSLYNTGPHAVDQALDIAGFNGVPEVKAFMNRVNTYGDAEDFAKVLMWQEDKPVVEVEVSCCSVYPQYTVYIHAQNGGLKATTQRIDYRYYKPEEAPEQKLILTPLSKADGTPAYCGEPLKMYDESWELPENIKDLFEYNTTEFYRMLYGVLAEGKSLTITPEEVYTQIAVMEEAHRQNPLSKTVNV